MAKFKYKYNIGDILYTDYSLIKILDRKIEEKIYYKKDGSKNKNNIKRYKIKCLTCNNEKWIIESCVRWCSVCNNTRDKCIKGINDIATTNPELVKYFVNIEDAYKYSYGSNKKVLCKCPFCGHNKEYVINKLCTLGFSCPKCSDGISYPNKFMFNLLKELGIEFKTEYSPKWIRPKKYDFYIPSKNLIIEMDGAFHFIDNKLNGKTAKKSKEIDYYKDLKAKEHNINIIRINCNYGSDKSTNRDNFIKLNVIKSNLSDIFDLSKIDWNKIFKLSNENIINKIYCYINNKNNIKTPNEIAKILKLSPSTIINYYNKCKEIFGEENVFLKLRKQKYVVAFKESEIILFSNNAEELVRNFETQFNIKIYASHVRSVCMGNRKTHKGFTFKYLDDLTKEEIEKLKYFKLNNLKEVI